ncbi:MAG TPA: hypothetical protein VHS56_08655 [Candidatus Cybelea sp.]|nr:hypothetical protein [Candidatus Cybelea sp.]
MLAHLFLALMSIVFPPLDTPGGPIAMAATAPPIIAVLPAAPTQGSIPSLS